MTSKFQTSLESLPRPKSLFCLPLKFACIFSALIAILYSVFGVAQCTAALEIIPSHVQKWDLTEMMMYGTAIAVTITHAVTLFLSTLMLVGVICDKPYLLRPWLIWVSVQVMISILLFVFWSTMNMINQFGEGSLAVYVVEFLILLIRLYMLTIVSAYYQRIEMEKGENERLVNFMNSESWYNV